MEVQIIGGGLSGLATALTIKQFNPTIDVVVNEKHKKIGFNTDGRQCGEAHNIDKEWVKWKPSNECIASDIKHAETIIGNNVYHFYPKADTAWILNRPKFISELAENSSC